MWKKSTSISLVVTLLLLFWTVCISVARLVLTSSPGLIKMRSRLGAQFMAFFQLTARILTFRDKKYRILTFRDKTESYLTAHSLSGSLCLFLALSGSHSSLIWLPLALSGSLWLAVRLSLALSGSLWLSLALSGSLWLALRLSLAPSGSLWLSIALQICLQSPCSAHKALARLRTPFLSSSTLISPGQEDMKIYDL